MAEEDDFSLPELAADVEGEAAPVANPPSTTRDIPDFPTGPEDLKDVYDIPIQVVVVLGSVVMKVNELMKLGVGALIELDTKVGEPIDIYVNNRLIARGEIVVVEDRLAVSMTEIIKHDRQ